MGSPHHYVRGSGVPCVQPLQTEEQVTRQTEEVPFRPWENFDGRWGDKDLPYPPLIGPTVEHMGRHTVCMRTLLNIHVPMTRATSPSQLHTLVPRVSLKPHSLVPSRSQLCTSAYESIGESSPVTTYFGGRRCASVSQLFACCPSPIAFNRLKNVVCCSVANRSAANRVR